MQQCTLSLEDPFVQQLKNHAKQRGVSLSFVMRELLELGWQVKQASLSNQADPIQAVLEHCQSVKAKRLLLCLADHYQHGWLDKLNLNRINLGRGKRVIAGGGRYVPQYQLSIPDLGDHDDDSQRISASS